MARTTRSAATERAYLHFAPPFNGVVAHSPAAAAGTGEDFDESDIWGAFAPSAAPADPPPPPRARPLPAAAARKSATKPLPAAVVGGRAAHGSLPVNIPDWSKILGDEYHRTHYAAAAGDWEVDDGDDEDAADAAVIPPHELAWRRRAASLSVHGGTGVAGRTLKVRDAVWKRTTGFQD
ncbi:unnamed protein product [Urochloa decumbens]|uniref:Uncharacterized protein n=1 Tax=Urochloa decumbens TaxID=240449 RepID=A0ABC9CHK6_9POAL